VCGKARPAVTLPLTIWLPLLPHRVLPCLPEPRDADHFTEMPAAKNKPSSTPLTRKMSAAIAKKTKAASVIDTTAAESVDETSVKTGGGGSRSSGRGGAAATTEKITATAPEDKKKRNVVDASPSARHVQRGAADGDKNISETTEPTTTGTPSEDSAAASTAAPADSSAVASEAATPTGDPVVADKPQPGEAPGGRGAATHNAAAEAEASASTVQPSPKEPDASALTAAASDQVASFSATAPTPTPSPDAPVAASDSTDAVMGEVRKRRVLRLDFEGQRGGVSWGDQVVVVSLNADDQAAHH